MIGTAKIASPGKEPVTETAVRSALRRIDRGRRSELPSPPMSTSSPRSISSISRPSASAPLKSRSSRERRKKSKNRECRPGIADSVTLTVKSGMHVWVYGNCLPEGVTIDEPSSVLRLTGGQLTGTLVFKAAANARPVQRQLVPIIGEVSINFSLRMYFASSPFWLTVEAPPR